MKELNEYKAEIFRRSQARIAARRKMRQRILLGSSLVCICVLVSLSVFLQRKPHEAENWMTNGCSAQNDNGSCSGAYVTIQQGEKTSTQTDPQRVRQMLSILYGSDATTKSAGADNAENNGAAKDTGDFYSGSEQEITVSFDFEDENGQHIHFTLQGNVVRDEAGEETVLSESALSELQQLMK